MKNNQNIIIIILFAAVCALAGCDMDLQKDYQYEFSNYDNKISGAAWDLIQARPDLFSELAAAIEYVEDVEPDIKKLYTDPNNTYLLLTNMALTNNDATDAAYRGSYFRMNSVWIANPDYDEEFNPAVADSIWGSGTAWQQYDKKQVAEMLKYHVLKGRWGYEELGASKTWHDTYASGDTTKVYLYITNDRYGYLYVNDYVGVPAAYPWCKLTASLPAWSGIKPRTTSLQVSNGVVHVMDRFVFPPTRQVLGL